MKSQNEKVIKLNADFKQSEEKNTTPRGLGFSVEDTDECGLTAICKVSEKITDLRKIDPWLMVFVDAIEGKLPERHLSAFRVELSVSQNQGDLESFRRRLSYLAINNEWHGSLLVGGIAVKNYPTCEKLLNRPKNEIVQEVEADRKDSEDSKGKIEKNFQTWLAGERREDNERLAVLGVNVKKGVPVLREFPVGVFDKVKSKDSRLLSKGWIDLVSINKRGELALIELKVNDPKLDVMAQSLDYALFFSCYRTELFECLTKQGLVPLSQESSIRCYIADNTFHPHFEKITHYYAPSSEIQWPFSFSQIILGRTTDFTRK